MPPTGRPERCGRAPAFLAITGPTASGKTTLSLAVADRLGGEIVSMDSRQVYRGMDIGTAKATPAERARVPHHGLDLVEPDERYSAGRFARDARRWIDEIRGRGRTPVLVGGTGFFLKALMEPLFAEPPLDEKRRSALRAYLRAQTTDRLAVWVRRLDPDRAALSIEGGRQRLSRTLEVALLSGRPLSAWHRTAPPEHDASVGVIVVVDAPREVLDARIEARAAAMVQEGLLDEVHGLLAAGFGPDAPGMTGTGYREVVEHLAGLRGLEDTIVLIARNTRRYARRQRTWFRNQLPPDTHFVDATGALEEQVVGVLDAWRGARHAAGDAGAGKRTRMTKTRARDTRETGRIG